MKIHKLARPAHSSHISFDDLYEEISHDWQHKAAALQARRWHALHQAEKSHNVIGRW